MQGLPGSLPTTDEDERRTDPFIKLLRRFELHRFWREHRTYSRAEAWIDMLFMAYHSPREIMWNGHAITLNPGEFMTSYRILTRRWRWSTKKVGNFLKDCESHGEIILHSGDSAIQVGKQVGKHPGTHVTITNYAEIHRSGKHPRIQVGKQVGKHYKRMYLTRENSSVVSPVDNCGQLSPTEKAARVFEVFRLASGKLTTPPTKRETAAIKRTIAANDGKWEPIRDMVRDSTARAVAHGDSVRSVTYGLAAWKSEQQEKQKAEHKKSIPVLSGLVSAVAGSVASPAQRGGRPGSVPVGRPGDGVTKAEQEAVKRLRRDMGLEE